MDERELAINKPGKTIDCTEPAQLHFRFTGNGMEFFRLWLVNLSLSILTFGIYSAWAKVRTRRYFYGHTRGGTAASYSGSNNGGVLNSGFEYLASPITLLKSRLIAVALLALYTFLANVSPTASLGLFIALYFVIPWAIYRSLRFNARVTRFRNVRFDFTGNAAGAYHAYLGWPLLGLITLGLLYPKAKQKQLHYRVNSLRYGNQPLSNAATTGQFWAMYGLGSLIGLLAMIGLGAAITFLVMPMIENGLGDAQIGLIDIFLGSHALNNWPITLAVFLTLLALILWPASFFRARRYQLTFNGTVIGKHRLNSTATTWGLYRVSFLPTLLLPFTLGLSWPWLKVAIARYKASQTFLVPGSDFSEIEDHSVYATSAIGEELGDVFDIGI